MSTNANVNKPTNRKVKDEDVNRKLQLYGIVTAFQQGKVPSNDQIDVALNSFIASKALSSPSKNLSDEGKVLVSDTREVVRLAKNLLLSKNEGNLIQDFIYQTTQFEPKQVDGVNAPISKDRAQRDGDEALKGLRTLGTLLITNGQFRKLLKDSTILLRDIAGDGASKAASKVKPSDDELAQIDEPAEHNTWHDTPDVSKDSLKNAAKEFYGGNPKEDAKDVVNAGAKGANVDPNNPGKDINNPDPTAQENVDRLADGQNAVKNTVQNKINSKVDPETKENIKETQEAYKTRAREYLKKKMPEDRRDQTIWRLKKMVLECQQHPDYTEAIETLLKLAEEYGKHAGTVVDSSTDSARQARGGLSAAEGDLRLLIERFANGTSTADIWDSIAQIYRDADNDEELKNWFKSMDKYIRRCLLEQGYILEDASTDEWNRLYDHGKYLLRDKYRGHTDRVLDEVKFVADQFDQDTLNKQFGDAVQKLFNDLGTDSSGNSTFKPHLVKDLTEVILPALFENIAYIPIPRIEYSDPQFDAIIENLVLESDNFMPNVLEIASDNYFRWGRKKIANKNRNTVDVKVSGIQMDLRDVSYHVKRKSGFPSLTDTGVADIMLPGEGFSFRMKISTADAKDRENFFKVDKVDVDVKNLKIKLIKSNHKALFNMVNPFLMKVVRAPLQKAVEKAIKDQCHRLDSFLYQIKKEADRAAEEVVENPEDAPNVYQRYYNAAQKRFLQGKEKANEVAADKKVNVAMTKQDSIFPNISLPGGISTKATEYKELAGKGDKWESPVFSIGSAGKSTDIPSAPKVVQKPHDTATPTHHGSTNGAVAVN